MAKKTKLDASKKKSPKKKSKLKKVQQVRLNSSFGLM